MGRLRITSLYAVAVLLASLPTSVVAQSGTEVAAPVAFTATILPGPQSRSFESLSEERADGVQVSTLRGRCWSPTIVESSDSRLDGSLTYCLDENRYSVGDESFVVKTGTFRIENATGAWQGSRLLTDWTDPSSGDQMLAGDVAVLAGEDGYDGLYAVMTFLPDWSDIRGVIVDAPPPEAPTPPNAE